MRKCLKTHRGGIGHMFATLNGVVHSRWSLWALLPRCLMLGLWGILGTSASRSTRSGAIFSPFAVPYQVNHVDICDFLHREQEQRATRILDEDSVELQPIPIDLNLDLPPEPVARIAPATEKRRATPSAARIRLANIPSRSQDPVPPPSITLEPIAPFPDLRDAFGKPKIIIPRAPAVPVYDAFGKPKIVIPRQPPTPAVPVYDAFGKPKIVIPRKKPTPTAAAKAAKRKYHHRLRRHTREEERQNSDDPRRKKHVARRVKASVPIFTELDISGLSHTSTAWIGLRDAEPSPGPHSLADVHDPALRMTFLNWDGWVCRPLIDAKRRLFALLAGRPGVNSDGRDTYQEAIDEATRLFNSNSPLASGDGRRGDFPAVSVGLSYGGGQQRPGHLLNTKANASICAVMLASWAFQRIIGFSDSMFRNYAPNLHRFYHDQMRLLRIAATYLTPLLPFIITVFAACTFNFGPNAVTRPHLDAANLVWGWCCITAFGCFNPDLGGHLILWDLRLVIRFPPGSTIMIPSALLRHSNVSIQQGETRYSFTQFTAGGLFRWIANGNCSDKTFYLKASSEELQAREDDCAHRWENGLKMFQVWNPDTKTFEEQGE
ncbi:hypothetical protein C8R46DRAFT_1050701 [Mycena filopes]|nr:hypothetical protein C8R46DRAFT_1050701 [Mycena filopes]